MNLHKVACAEGRLPEEFVIGADNTVKETKNSVCLWLVIWLLCVLKDTPLWSVLFVFLLVGHTHNRLDRFFGRLSTALAGRDYFTLDDLFEIIVENIRSHKIEMAHMTHHWDWYTLKEHMPVFHKLSNVHGINIFRLNGGIWIKWKEYLTSEAWSRPILLLPPRQVEVVASLRPPLLPRSFDIYDKTDPGKKTVDMQTRMLNWVNKLELALAQNASECERRASALDWLRRVITQVERQTTEGPPLQEIVGDLCALGGAGMPSLSAPPAPEDFASDALVQLFPGGDHPPMPADTLVGIGGIWMPEPDPGLVVPGTMVICAAPPDTKYYGERALFTLGLILRDPGDVEGDSVLVSWWIPGRSPLADSKPGRKADVVDAKRLCKSLKKH